MSRKITVLVEKTQSKVVLESNATTLGELKSELNRQGVTFNSDDVFKESRTKSILASNESVLPTNVPWKGSVTNELVFMITAPHKKIKSGAMSRAEVYAKVKELGLQDRIQKGEGKNFTQCSTAVLVSYIEKSVKEPSSTPITENKPVKKVKVTGAAEANLDALHSLLEVLVDRGIIADSLAYNIWGVATGQPAQPVEEGPSYDDLLEEFDF